MYRKLFASCALSLLFLSCSDNDDQPQPIPGPYDGTVLLLRVDYATNAFEAAAELDFPNGPSAFTVTSAYVAPSDFGNLKLYWQETGELLFDGDIHWNGLGDLHFPENFQPASSFPQVQTEDFASPAGFENVFNPNDSTYDYLPMWSQVQGLAVTRQYLQDNPTQTAKVFLYTPSVGVGNPEEWDWYFILKR